MDLEKQIPITHDFLEFILDDAPAAAASSTTPPQKKEQFDNPRHDNMKELIIKPNYSWRKA